MCITEMELRQLFMMIQELSQYLYIKIGISLLTQVSYMKMEKVKAKDSISIFLYHQDQV